MKPMFQQLKAGREQLDALIKSGPFDEAKVRSIAKAQADTLADMIVAKQRMKSKIYAVLTPEQHAKAEKLREAWKTLHEDDGPMHKPISICGIIVRTLAPFQFLTLLRL